MSIRNLDGCPCRIKSNADEILGKAFEVLGVYTIVKANKNSLIIGDTKINAVRSYTISRSIEFDDKIKSAIRSELKMVGFDIQVHNQKIDEVNKNLEDISPKYHLGSMGNRVSTKDIERFLAQAKAVENYVSQSDVMQIIANNDALKVLFDNQNYDEIVTE